jgi:hypothetical protein
MSLASSSIARPEKKVRAPRQRSDHCAVATPHSGLTPKWPATGCQPISGHQLAAFLVSTPRTQRIQVLPRRHYLRTHTTQRTLRRHPHVTVRTHPTKRTYLPIGTGERDPDRAFGVERVVRVRVSGGRASLGAVFCRITESQPEGLEHEDRVALSRSMRCSTCCTSRNRAAVPTACRCHHVAIGIRVGTTTTTG